MTARRKPLTKLRQETLSELQLNKPYSHMTRAMRALEQKTGKSIMELLSRHSGTGRQIADKLGIDESTVCYWRMRLGIRAGRSTGRPKGSLNKVA